MNKRDQAVINVFLKISKICCVFPTERPSRRYYSYQVLIFISTLLYGIFCIYNNAVNYTFNKSSLDIFMEALSLSFSVMLGFSIQFPTIWRPDEWRKLYQNLKTGGKEAKTGNKDALFEVLIVHLFFFIRLILTIYAWLTMIGIRAALNHLFRPLVDYFSMIFVLLIVHVNIIIKRRFFLMNLYLKRANCVRHVQEIYTQTTHLIDDFNTVFGYQILFMMARAISVILECLHNSLKYADLKSNVGINMFFCSWFYSITILVIEATLYLIRFLKICLNFRQK